MSTKKLNENSYKWDNIHANRTFILEKNEIPFPMLSILSQDNTKFHCRIFAPPLTIIIIALHCCSHPSKLVVDQQTQLLLFDQNEEANEGFPR